VKGQYFVVSLDGKPALVRVTGRASKLFRSMYGEDFWQVAVNAGSWGSYYRAPRCLQGSYLRAGRQFSDEAAGLAALKESR
jgi:hypothetical protein